MSLVNIIPGYREAIETERTAREVAFLCAPDSICGVLIAPLTIHRFTVLDAIKSPFVAGGEISHVDVARFVWILSPKFSEKNDWLTRIRRDSCYRACRGINFGEACAKIESIIADSFADTLGGKPAGQNDASYYSWIAAIVDTLASEYGWNEEQILNIPLTRVWQYLRIIKLRTSVKNEPMFNRSDKVRGAWLAAQNKSQN